MTRFKFLSFTALVATFLAQQVLAETEFAISIISDSHGNCRAGEVFNQQFRQVANTYVHSLSIGGSSPLTWMHPTKRFVSPLGVENRGSTGEELKLPRKLVKTTTPFFPDWLLTSFAKNPSAKKITIINLGTNAQDVAKLPSEVASMVKTVFQQNSDCAWISPPHNINWTDKKMDTYYSAVQQGIDLVGIGGPSGKKCLLINSHQFGLYPKLPKGRTVDGIHYCWHPELLKVAEEYAKKISAVIKINFGLPPNSLDQCADCAKEN